MTSVALLDINVLVALFDPNHVHHEAAHGWFSGARRNGWASCPLTENGLVRILSNSAYPGGHEAPSKVRQRLERFCASGQHTFWPDHLSLRDDRRFDLSGVTHRQLTDVYLLGLATEKGGRLATLDRSIPVRSVIGADRDRLEVIPA